MSDLFLGTSNTPSVRLEGLGDGIYVWGEGSNDIFLGTDKDFNLVENTTKLQQDITKILMTDRFKNTIYPIYGSTIRDVIGGKADLSTVKANVKTAVIEALAVLQFLNADNPNQDEQISVINTIKVDMSDPGEIKVSIQITTKSGKVINTVLPV
jgi:hypothetical protein